MIRFSTCILLVSALVSSALASNPPSFAFHWANNIPVGTTPFSAAVADLNGDGFQDIVVVNHGSANVSVLLGTGNANFKKAVDYTVPAGPYAVAIGDFNGDGKLDLAVTSSSAKNVTILLGNGDGTFQTPGKSYAAGGEAVAIVAGDFNGDGKLDLVTANFDTGAIGVLLGNGDGTFQAAQTFNAGAHARALALWDFNQDGLLDLAVANEGSGTVTILLGNGDGTFQTGVAHTLLGTGASSIAVGNFYGSGYADLLVANDAASGGDIELLQGMGGGEFGSPVSIGTDGGTLPISVVSADFNGDETWDTAFINNGSSNVGVLAGDTAVVSGYGNGAFTEEPKAIAGTGAFFVATGDFNNDGLPDLVVVNSGANTVYVLTSVASAPANPPLLWTSATSLDFGLGFTGAATPRLNVMLRYTGLGPISPAIAISGKFYQSNNCGSSLAAGATCTIEVYAVPASGNNNGAMTIKYSSTQSLSIPLNASGTSNPFSFSPGSLTFKGLQPVGVSSAPQALTISNGLGEPVTITKIHASVPGFSETNNCPATLQARSSCTIEVSFTPTTIGVTTGYLGVTGLMGASTVAASASLSGTGTALTFTPSPLLTFPSTPFGSTSGPETITVKNVSPSQTVTFSSIQQINYFSGAFSMTNGCGTSLAPGASCSVSVTYHATAVGSENGQILFTDNGGGSPQGVGLQGTGLAVSPTVKLTVSPASISPGSPATLTASVTIGGTPLTLGNVTFLDGLRSLGTVQVVRNTSGGFALGTATLKTRSFLVGTHSIYARYNANQGALGATSSAQVLTVTAPIGTLPTTSTFTSSGSAGDYAFTGDLTAIGPAVPTGTFSFFDQTLNLPAVQLDLSVSDLVPSLSVPSSVSGKVGYLTEADFNNDGILDLAGSAPAGGALDIALGKGDGTFAAPSSFSISTGVNGVAAGDFNGDGRIDLMVGTGSSDGSYTGQILLFLGNGDGTFQAPVSIAVPDVPEGPFYVADFNGNGFMDLAFSAYTEDPDDEYGAGFVDTVTANADGTFRLLGVSECGGGAWSQHFAPIALTDGGQTALVVSCISEVEDNGRRDVAIVNLASGQTFSVLEDQNFVDYPIVAGDLNNDGFGDFIYGQQIFFGNGDGTFQAPVTNSGLNSTPDSEFLGGLSDLGSADLAQLYIGNGQTYVELFKNDGKGNLSLTATYPTGLNAGPMVAGDFNDDGLIDFAFDYADKAALGQYDFHFYNPNFDPAGTGTHNIDAQYSGDTHYQASASTPIALTAVSPSFGAYFLNFGSITAGTQQSLTVTLYNSSSSTVNIPLAFSPAGPPFSIGTGTTCGSTLAANSNCTVQVTFSPSTAGYFNASLYIPNSNPTRVRLSGTGK